MKPSEALTSNRGVIRRVVESHRARNARVFGSVLHGQDTGSSDLDILGEALMNPSWLHQSTQGEKCDFHLASKSMTDVIDFGGTSVCRTESLIQSEIPHRPDPGNDAHGSGRY